MLKVPDFSLFDFNIMKNKPEKKNPINQPIGIWTKAKIKPIIPVV